MNSAMHWFSTAFDGVVGFVPNLVAGLLILAIGYVVARVLARVTRPLLHRIHFDRLIGRLGLSDKNDPEAGSRWGGTAVFVVVMLAAIMQAARAMGLDFVAVGVSRLIGYAPHLLGAIVIFGAALYFANWVRGRMLPGASVVAVTGERRLVASSVRAGILAVGAFMALRELQIAPEIVTVAFTLTLASIALAAALAFGLGSRNVAAQMTQEWYDKRSHRNGFSRDATTVTSPGLGPNDRPNAP